MKTRAIPALIGALATLSLSSCFYFPLGAIDNEEWTKTEPYPGVSESIASSESSSMDSPSSSSDPFAPTLDKLTFRLNGSSSYEVAMAHELIKGDVIIPEVYEGLPVTSIQERGFSSCQITSIFIPSSIKEIGIYAFQYCSSLTTVTLNEGLTIIDEYAFWMCESLSSIIIPDSVTRICEHAFGECHSLETAQIGSGLFILEKAVFSWCWSLESITVSEDNPLYTSEEGILYDKSKTEIVAFPMAKEIIYVPEGVTSIGDGAYCGATIETIYIPDSVTSIGERAFYNCEELRTFIFGSNVRTVKEMAFAYCPELREIVLPNSIETIGREAFYWCGLTSVVVPDSPVNIGDYAFSMCESLSSFSLGKNVSYLGGTVFGMCSALKTLDYGGMVSDWENITKDQRWNISSSLERVVCTDDQINLVHES